METFVPIMMSVRSLDLKDKNTIKFDEYISTILTILKKFSETRV